jgi:hypothetical protein
VPADAPEPVTTPEDTHEPALALDDAAEEEIAALVAERDAETAEAEYEYRRSGAVAPHPAWYVNAEYEVELANGIHHVARHGNAGHEAILDEAVNEYRHSGAREPYPAWFVDIERDVECELGLVRAIGNRFRFENGIRARLAGRAVRRSLPPRASFPVRNPRRSARVPSPRDDDMGLEELI